GAVGGDPWWCRGYRPSSRPRWNRECSATCAHLLQQAMVRKGQGLDRDRAIVRRDDPARGWQVGLTDPHVRIGEAFDVGQSAVLRVEVIDGVGSGQYLLPGCARPDLDEVGE